MHRILVTAVSVALAGTLVPGAAARPAGDPPLALRSISAPAHLVSGGDVLVEVAGAATTGRLRVTLNGTDVSRGFARRADGRVLGLVPGLRLGSNVLVARGRGREATLQVRNHRRGGPVFAGPQVQPWVCGTEAAGLGAALDTQCNGRTSVTYRYRSTRGQFAAYDPAAPPSDVATTRTDQGRTVPFIVRTERGTVDRGIYELSVLADPRKALAPWTPPAGWNGKLTWVFGGGTKGSHKQGVPGSTFEPAVLGRGFMIAQSGLTIHGQNANDVVVAEVVAMVKEHVRETYGPIRYTIGQGCSGGGIQQHMVAATYPGLLDGLIPMCSYPDIWTTALEVFDCSLLLRYFAANPQTFPVVQQRSAVEGHYSESSCLSWDALFAPRVDAADPVNCDLDATVVYHPQTNPGGVRCGLNDYAAAVWGPRPRAVWDDVEKRLGRGFTGRPFDNTGVQYGLAAFDDGVIDAEQFLDLNTEVGGFDIDGVPVARRSVADPGTLETAYRTGQVTNGRELGNVPIIDLRGHDNEEIHTTVYSYVLRERLARANGSTANHALWLSNIPLVGDPAWSCGGLGVAGVATVPGFESCDPASSALLAMDEWLTGVERDRSARPLHEKVAAHRPARAVDSCWVAGRQVRDPGACRAANPYFSTPRMVAGGPLANDVLKCRLTPVRAEGYRQELTSAQLVRLRAVFPGGVCDYRRPGVAQQPPDGTWHDYSAGRGGVATRRLTSRGAR